MRSKQVPSNLSHQSTGFGVLLLGVAGITLYFYKYAYDPFNTHKLIILLLTAAWLSGYLFRSYRHLGVFRAPQEKFIVYPALFFITSLLVSLLFTDIKIIGLIGELQRRNGALSYFALTIILLYLSRTVSFDNVKRLIPFVLSICGLLALYGSIQIAGKDFVSWVNPYNAMISTTGNPNFASSLLAVLSLISVLTLFNREVSSFLKPTAIFVFTLSIYCIYQSQSRQGFLVIFFGLIFYLSAKILFSNKTFLKLFLAIPFSLVILSIFGMLQVGPLTDLLYKPSVSVRGFYWQAAIRMFQNDPITGVGLDSYGSYFREFVDPQYLIRHGTDLTSNNAHNVFLQMFATGGIFVGLGYIILVLSVLYMGLSVIKNSIGANREFALGIVSGWIGFQSQSVISIDNLSISIWGWVLAGAISGLYIHSSIESQAKVSKSMKSNADIIQPVISSIILIPVLLIGVLMHRMETNLYSLSALNQSKNNEATNVSLELAKKVLDNPISDPSYKFQVALIFADMGRVNESFDIVSQLNTIDPRNTDYLGWLSIYKSANGDNLKAAEYRKSISIYDPYNYDNYVRLIELYQTLGNREAAMEIKNKMQAWAPSSALNDPNLDWLK